MVPPGYLKLWLSVHVARRTPLIIQGKQHLWQENAFNYPKYTAPIALRRTANPKNTAHIALRRTANPKNTANNCTYGRRTPYSKYTASLALKRTLNPEYTTPIAPRRTPNLHL